MTGTASSAAAYEAFADEYDERVGEHLAARRAKSALLRRVRALTSPGDLVVDVGCGTGSEAVALARTGRRVVGVDVAPRMLELARAKARRAGVVEAATFRHGACVDAQSTWLPEGAAHAALVYSAYGVLNLEPDPGRALAALAALVRPGGHVIVGTLNPTALFELALYPLALRLKGFRKAAAPTLRLKIAHGRDEEVECRLPSNVALARAGSACGLDLVEEVGLHVFAPPPSDAMMTRLPRLVKLLNRLEPRIESRLPFARLGYFSLLVFRRASR